MYFMLEFVFWAALTLVVYAYVIYPVLILQISRTPTDAATADRIFSEVETPSVTVIVSAYNEEIHIAARIQNLLEQDYPADSITILIGSETVFILNS